VSLHGLQVVLPPAVEERTIALCVRKPTLLAMNLADYGRQGAFAHTNVGPRLGPTIAPPGDCGCEALSVASTEAMLRRLYRGVEWAGFLRPAVQARKNIVISAGTFAGEKALLNALLKEIPAEAGVVTIEDTPEIRPPQRNCPHLLYSRGGQGEACVTPADLFEASLRLTPDPAIMGELRGAEALPILSYSIPDTTAPSGSNGDADGRRNVSEIRYEAAKTTDFVCGVGRGGGVRQRLAGACARRRWRCR